MSAERGWQVTAAYAYVTDMRKCPTCGAELWNAVGGGTLKMWGYACGDVWESKDGKPAERVESLYR